MNYPLFMKRNLIALPVALIFIFSISYGYSGGPPNGVAGDPPNNANCTQCHSSFGVNTGDGLLQILNMPTEYKPDSTYLLTVSLEDEGQRIWGFEATAIFENGNRAGNFNTIDNSTQISTPGGDVREYIKQTADGNQSGSTSATWEFNWTAPTTGSGDVQFYLAGNAANRNSSTSGDYIYTINANVPEQVLGIANGPGQTPQNYTLMTAYPNPFNPVITLNLSGIPAGKLGLSVINLSGQTLGSMELTANGNHHLEVPFDLTGLPSGSYYIRADYEGGSMTTPIVKLK